MPPYETKGMTIQSVNQLTEHFQQVMQTEFDNLNKEIGINEKYNSGDYRIHKKIIPRAESQNQDSNKAE